MKIRAVLLSICILLGFSFSQVMAKPDLEKEGLDITQVFVDDSSIMI